MAIDTVPQPTDICPREEWRAGMVEPPAGHVFGATALDDVSWQRLDEKPHGVFLLVEVCAHTGELVMVHGRFLTRLALYSKIHRLIELTPGAFDPQRGPFRLVVREQ